MNVEAFSLFILKCVLAPQEAGTRMRRLAQKQCRGWESVAVSVKTPLDLSRYETPEKPQFERVSGRLAPRSLCLLTALPLVSAAPISRTSGQGADKMDSRLSRFHPG